VICTKTGVVVEIGEGSVIKPAHILVTTPNYFLNKLSGRDVKMDLKKVKMVIFDEADEVFKTENNHPALDILINTYFNKWGIKPQYLLFSATFDELVMKSFAKYIYEVQPFTVKK
jgi:superfamily II DNA/RNA helicase